MGRPSVGEEVRVPGRDDAVERELAGPAVVRVEAIALPRVVTEDRVGSHRPDRRAHRRALGGSRSQLPVDEVEELDARRAQRRGSVELLGATLHGERLEVRVGVPRALRAVGQHEQVHRCAGGGPPREGCAAAELDVVRVGADGEHPCRDVGHAPVGRSSAARSSGTSTSNAKSGSRTSRTARPSRRASAAWRRNEPGP